MHCNCSMGLFPEVERAWLTIDSDIYGWRYEDGGDLAYFDGLADIILNVAMVTLKPGLLQPHIVHMLALSTPVEVVLLGVSPVTSCTPAAWLVGWVGGCIRGREGWASIRVLLPASGGVVGEEDY